MRHGIVDECAPEKAAAHALRVVRAAARDDEAPEPGVHDGAVDAHEVAQLYVTVPGAGATTPLAIPYRSLQGFARPMLKAGSTQRVTFTLEPSQYSTIQADGTALVTDGSYSVSVSGHQPADQAGLVQSNVVCGSFEVASGVVMVQF